MGEFSVRLAQPIDAGALVEIYRPYVERTSITFEEQAPSVAEFTRRIATIQTKYPYLVLEHDGKVCGYAYAKQLRSRSAYNRSVETSIYIKRGHGGMGGGRMLYGILEELLKRQNVQMMFACITREEGSEKISDSRGFHERMGFKCTGTLHYCGYKAGKWYGVDWLEKPITKIPQTPEPFIPFPTLMAQQSGL